jgi:hypothetical protein
VSIYGENKMMNPGPLLPLALGLGLLLGCQSELEGLVCTQIDLVPRDLEMAGDGRDTTVVDVAVCACSDATTCANADLIDGISVELQTDAGTLADDVLYLEKGKGAVNWTAPKLICTDCGEAAPAEDDTSRIAVQNAYESIQGTLVGTALDFTGKAQVHFDLSHRFPSLFFLSAESTEIDTEANDATEISLTAEGLEDGELVSIVATLGTIIPAQQAIRGETATFLYTTETLSEKSTAVLIGQIDALNYTSDPLTLSLNPAPEDLSISPASAKLVIGSTVTLLAIGGEGALDWASPEASHLTCNGEPGLGACNGSTKAPIALATDPCETESTEEDSGQDSGSSGTDSGSGSDTGSAAMTSTLRCEIAIWVTDEEGHQAESSLLIY